MLDEFATRRQDFLPGVPIRLADGQWWTFPTPPRRAVPGATTLDGDTAFGPDYTATIAAILEAEDEVERLRAELALAICLLEQNYDLPPGALFALLAYHPGDPALPEVQEAFHRMALEHVRQSRSSADAVAPHEAPGRAVGGVLIGSRR